MIISIDTEKNFAEIQHYFMIKTMKELGIEVSYLSIVKDILGKLTDSITLKGKSWNYFLLLQRQNSVVHSNDPCSLCYYKTYQE
jgi:hypothetical protein